MKKITIYSTPTCHYCEMAKSFFDAKGLKYVVHDVSTNLIKRKEMIMKSDQMGVPVIIIGRKVLTGFDADKIEAALN